ncbi:hypothetical protein FOZ62_026813, partial [Perkinsus olseni]
PWSERTKRRHFLSMLYIVSIIAALVVGTSVELVVLVEDNVIIALLLTFHCMVVLYCRIYLIWWFSHRDNAISAMTNYAHRHNFRKRWRRLNVRNACLASLAGVAYLGLLLSSTSNYGVVLAEAFAHATITLMVWVSASAISFCSLAADDFARRSVCTTKLDGIVVRYNVLCAAVRKVSSSIGQAILNLTNGGAVTLVLILLLLFSDAIETHKVEVVIGGSLLLAMSAVLLQMVATVNLKFQRLPTVINIMNFGNEIDHDKWFVVSFMQLIEGGFYLYGVRLNRGAAMKALWLVAVSVGFMIIRMLGVSLADP